MAIPANNVPKRKDPTALELKMGNNKKYDFFVVSCTKNPKGYRIVGNLVESTERT